MNDLDWLITDLKSVLARLEAMKAQPQTVAAQATPEPAPSGEFEQLQELLFSSRWPAAVNADEICDDSSENEKMERGRGVLDVMVPQSLEGLKFLDFGCGEGHSVMAAKERKAFSVGYDINCQFLNRFPQLPEGVLFTNAWDEVVSQGPYDVILLFDVLDHLEEEEPSTVLGKVASVLKDTGTVHLRVHPWGSRHATHLYKKLNKAFAHIVFTEEEMAKLVGTHEKNLGIRWPLRQYAEFFAAVGMEYTRTEHTQPVEDFFKNTPLVTQRIIKNYTQDGKFPEFQMSMQFLDYVLRKKK